MRVGKKIAVMLSFGVFFLANAISTSALALPDVRQGDVFFGADAVSGESCTVRITRDLDRSIWGSVIELEYTVGRTSKFVRVTNHPFIGGNSFGKSIYLTSTRTDQSGVEYSHMESFWAQLNLNEQGQEASLEYIHLGTYRGGLMIGEPRGDQTRCVLSRQ